MGKQYVLRRYDSFVITMRRIHSSNLKIKKKILLIKQKYIMNDKIVVRDKKHRNLTFKNTGISLQK